MKDRLGSGDFRMPQHKSAEKRLRRDEKARVVNHSRISRIRTFVKKCDQALKSGDAGVSADAFKAVQSELARGVSRGSLHKNAAARKTSRLAKRLKVVSAEKTPGAR